MAPSPEFALRRADVLPVDVLPVNERGFVPAISGLRALSVVSVLIYHINKNILPAGFVGVDFFFVISGYVVTRSLTHRGNQTLFQFVAGFYQRRIIRVMPALLVFIPIAIFVSCLFIPYGFLLEQSNHTAKYAFFGISNIFLYRAQGDYFAPTAEFNFFTHTWSLGVEEQFYLIFPPISYFIISTRSSAALKRRIAFLLVGLGAVSLCCSAYFSRTDESFAFYMIITRFWELAVGSALAFRLSETLPNESRALSGWPTTIIGLALFAISVTVPAYGRFPFPSVLLPIASAASITWLSVSLPESTTSRLLAARPLVYVGNISYSLYLWHWFFVVLARWTVGLDSIAAQAAVVVASFTLAVLSYGLIENPVRYSPAIRRATQPVFLAGFVVVMVGALGAAWSSAKLGSDYSFSTVTRNWDLWYPYVDGNRGRPRTLCRVSQQVHVIPNGDRDALTPVDCAGAKMSQVVVVGDSHAGAYGRLFFKIAGNENRPVVIETTPSCALFRLALYGGATSQACEDAGRRQLSELRDHMQAGDVLFLPALRVKRFRDQGEDAILETAAIDYADYPRAADRVELDRRAEDLRPFADKGIRIIIEAPEPVLVSQPYLCADWYMRGKSSCQRLLDGVPRQDLDQRLAYGRFLVTALAERLPHAVVWDPFPVLCPGQVCEAFRDGKPLYFDGDHLSGYGNDLLYDSFSKVIAPPG